jgi:hypothetical protein
MTKNGNTISWRVERLERCQEETERKLDTILENHLPHLSQSISELKTRIDTQTAIQVGAIIIGAVILKYI